ncbi:2Fe-2S iron-sulfur cluster-binding protein [Paracoccus sp. (in: a-proteobacteria)]|uniref:2Fe-2S iron-sulfur cluster-binding protein n=1 Tax=Paracoccus sp. TaxID=267 RepID=UPI003A883361
MAQKHQVPHPCRAGLCGLCRARLGKGDRAFQRSASDRPRRPQGPPQDRAVGHAGAGP